MFKILSYAKNIAIHCLKIVINQLKHPIIPNKKPIYQKKIQLINKGSKKRRKFAAHASTKP